MAVAMTYSSLITTIQAYLQVNNNNSPAIANIPTFVALAQARIPREMKLLGFRSEVTGNFDGGTQNSGLMSKPSDWRKTIAFYVATGSDVNVHTPILQRDYSYIRTVYSDPSLRGTPRFYGDADYQHWLVQPSPSSSMAYKICYYSTLTQLDNTAQTNWLTVNAPDLLLYASLLEAVPFLKVDERIPVWQGLYQNAKTALQAQDIGEKYDQAANIFEPQPPSIQPR